MINNDTVRLCQTALNTSLCTCSMQEHRLVLHFYIWEVQMTFRKHTKPSCLDR